MQVQTPRKASTMARRFLEKPSLSFQKGKNSHLSPTHRKVVSPPHSRCSPHTQISLSASYPQHSFSLSHTPHDMTIIIISALRKLLTNRGLKGFIQVAEVPAHPNALEMSSTLNIDTRTTLWCAESWA